MQADASAVDAGPRSDAAPKGTNGKVRLLSVADLDGRTKAAQRARATNDEVLADLGGAENLSTLERLAASHVSIADAMITDFGVRWLRGDPVDSTIFATLVNTFNRSAAALGWTRRAKDVTPRDDVSEWIEGRLASKRRGAGEAASDAAAEATSEGGATSEATNESQGHSECAGSNDPAQAGAAPLPTGAHSRGGCERAGTLGDGGVDG
jgi:hypothetical protein